MPHFSEVTARTASLELTPVGGRIYIVAAFASTIRNPATATDVGGLSEELDKLGFGEAHAVRGPPKGSPTRHPGLKRVSESQENGTRIKCQEGPQTGAVPSGGDRWLFRVQQQQIMGGQHVLRLSVWRVSDTRGPPTLIGKAQGGSGDAAAPIADEGGPSKQSQNGWRPHRYSACNFYFRLPRELPSLRLLGASFSTGREASAAEVSEAVGSERQHEIRLSLHCALRPGSLSEALQDREDRSLRSLTAFRLTCKGCGECVAQWSEATICLLPSALWTEAQGAAACEECACAPPFTRDLHAKPGRVCAGTDRLYLSPSDTKNVLIGPWGSYSEGKCRRRAAITCASCGNLLGSGKEWRDTSVVARFPGEGADLAPHELLADKETANSCTPGCCAERRESTSVHEGKKAEKQLPASPVSSEQTVEPSQGIRTEMSLLKRRIDLHSCASGSGGVRNLLERHSDLAAFTEELCTYSRAGSALRFLVLPFVPPRGAECPWEVGRQAAPVNICRPASSRIPEQQLGRNTGASAEAWVSVSKGSAAALDLRILLRECFVALSGTRDAGSQGRMAMKVLLREVRGEQTTMQNEKTEISLNRGPSRTHLARVGQRLFSELLRLRREAPRRGPEKNVFNFQEKPGDSGGSDCGEDAAVVFLPML
ncbi:hypothetical protein Esti_003799 [Eimeria stiedai]